MADIADQANDLAQQLNDAYIKAARDQTQAAQAKGACLWCDEFIDPLSQNQRWCDTDCRDAWQKRNMQKI